MRGSTKHIAVIAFLAAVLLLLPFRPASAQAADTAAAAPAEELDPKSLVLGHLGDSYWWHIGTFGGREVSLYLPVIVRSSADGGGWHFFSSCHLAEGASWEGFSSAPEGKYEGKIVEALAVILIPAKWYRRHQGVKEHPKGFTAFMEMAVESLQDDLIKPCVGENWKRFSPYLLTVFFFILINNFMSLIPFFPGGVNVTGNITVTFVLALASFLVINIFGGRAYWRDIFWPEVPAWLKVPVPIIPVIEFVGIFTKPFALMIRLFANMVGGHAAIICLICVIFVTAGMGVAVNGPMTVVSLLFAVFMNALEVLVAFLQAYVFTMLSGVFIGLAQEGKIEKSKK